jgi:hypothetical protein
MSREQDPFVRNVQDLLMLVGGLTVVYFGWSLISWFVGTTAGRWVFGGMAVIVIGGMLLGGVGLLCVVLYHAVIGRPEKPPQQDEGKPGGSQ